MGQLDDLDAILGGGSQLSDLDAILGADPMAADTERKKRQEALFQKALAANVPVIRSPKTGTVRVADPTIAKYATPEGPVVAAEKPAEQDNAERLLGLAADAERTLASRAGAGLAGAAAGALLGPVGAFAGGVAGALVGPRLANLAMDKAYGPALQEAQRQFATTHPEEAALSPLVAMPLAGLPSAQNTKAAWVGRGVGAATGLGIDVASQIAEGMADPKRATEAMLLGATMSGPGLTERAADAASAGFAAATSQRATARRVVAETYDKPVEIPPPDLPADLNILPSVAAQREPAPVKPDLAPLADAPQRSAEAGFLNLFGWLRGEEKATGPAATVDDPFAASKVAFGPNERAAVRPVLDRVERNILGHPNPQEAAKAMREVVALKKRLGSARDIATATRMVEKSLGREVAMRVMQDAGLTGAAFNPNVTPEDAAMAESLAGTLRTLKKGTSQRVGDYHEHKRQQYAAGKAEHDRVLAETGDPFLAAQAANQARAFKMQQQALEAGPVTAEQNAWVAKKIDDAGLDDNANWRLKNAWRQAITEGRRLRPAELRDLSTILGDRLGDVLVDQQGGLAGKTRYAVGVASATMREGLTGPDMSSRLRQGFGLLATSPTSWWKGNVAGLKAFASQGSYDAVREALHANPYYDLLAERGLEITGLEPDALPRQREEKAIPGLLSQIPVRANPWRAGNRDMAASMAVMRLEYATKLIDGYMEANAIDDVAKLHSGYVDSVVTFTNSLTGKGNLGHALNDLAPAVAGALFSARANKARVDILGLTDAQHVVRKYTQPGYEGKGFYASMDPAVRRAALASLVKQAALGASFMAMVKAGVDKFASDEEKKMFKLGTDPYSSEYGKMRFGNTRFALWGGNNQIARLAAQIVMGRQQLMTGAYRATGSGDGRKSRLDLIWNAFRMKADPALAVAIDQLSGTDFLGKPASGVKYWANKMNILGPDAYSAAKEHGVGAIPFILAAWFGADLQTYEQPAVRLEYDLREGVKPKEQVMTEVADYVQRGVITPSKATEIIKRSETDALSAAARDLNLEDLKLNKERVRPDLKPLMDLLIAHEEQKLKKQEADKRIKAAEALGMDGPEAVQKAAADAEQAMADNEAAQADFRDKLMNENHAAYVGSPWK